MAGGNGRWFNPSSLCGKSVRCAEMIGNVWPPDHLSEHMANFCLSPAIAKISTNPLHSFCLSVVRHFACSVPTAPTILEMYLVLGVRCISELEQADALKWLPS